MAKRENVSVKVGYLCMIFKTLHTRWESKT